MTTDTTSPPPIAPPRAHCRAKSWLPLTMLLSGAAAFLAIAADLHFHGLLSQCDEPIHKFLHTHSDPFGVILFSALSFLGEFALLGPFAFAVGIYLFLQRRLRPLFIWATALLGSAIINESLKHLFKVPRPTRYTYYVWETTHPGYSFPSGHTMGVAITAGALVLLARHLELITPKTFPRATAAVIALSLAVAFALLYMGVHTLTDVLSALAISLAWLGAIALLLNATRRVSAGPSPRE